MASYRNLAPSDFPFTIMVSDGDGQVVWAVTVLKPPPGTRVPLYIPPMAAEHGPVSVTTITGQGLEFSTGPYGEEWER